MILLRCSVIIRDDERYRMWLQLGLLLDNTWSYAWMDDRIVAGFLQRNSWWLSNGSIETWRGQKANATPGGLV